MDDMDERLAQVPSLLGRQFEQGFPAFTQAHPLQEPVLLHLQHGITIASCHATRSEPFCVGNYVNYVAYVACARIDKSSILAYVRKET